MAGKYVVEKVIGSGGMGVVVAARHLQLGERVALKFLLTATDESFVARFLREAQLSVRIKSEHVARVLDVATLDDGSPYMVIELLEGTDLDRLLRDEGPPPLPVALDYVLQACEAVADAHSLGIVHRDLKPANLFLTRRPDGAPLIKVLDFGISKVVGEFRGVADRSLTRADDMLGSPQYMAPEQVRDPRNVDARCDVFSLGSILYKLLTGRPAFEGGNAATVLAMVLSEPPRPLREHRPEIPPALEALVLGCLEKDPAARVPSVEVLAHGLVPFATRRPRRPWSEAVAIAPQIAPAIPAVTLSGAVTESRGGEVRQRRALVAAAVAVILMTLGAAIALSTWDPTHASARGGVLGSSAVAVIPAAPSAPAIASGASAPVPVVSPADVPSAEPIRAAPRVKLGPSASASTPRSQATKPKGGAVVDPLEDRQ